MKTRKKDSLAPKSREVKEFLLDFAPHGPWYLTALNAYKSGAFQGATFTNIDKAVDWAVERNLTQHNIWFSIAQVVPKPKKAKPTKEEVVSIDTLWADIDVDKKSDDYDNAKRAFLESVTTNLPEGMPKPTFVISSGNGYWPLYRLGMPSKAPTGANREGFVSSIEDRNRAIAYAFGADNCHNIDRIARLPGLVNWPTKTKREAGLVPVMSSYLKEWSDPSRIYALTDFPKRSAEEDGKGKGDDFDFDPNIGDLKPVTLEEIEKRAGENTRVRVEKGSLPAEKKPDRSKMVYSVIASLVGKKFDEAEIRFVLLNRDWKISEHIYAQGSHESQILKYVNRQIARVTRMKNARFDANKAGVPVANSTKNAILALHKLGLEFAFDEFTRRNHVTGLKDVFADDLFGDRMLDYILKTVGDYWGLEVSPTKMSTVISGLATENAFDSMVDYLDGLLEPPADFDAVGTLVRGFNVEDTPLNREILRCFLLNIIGRQYVAGFKADEVVVIEGPQGCYKSTAVKALCPHPLMFNDSLSLMAEPKVIIEEATGVLIVEFGELRGNKKGDVNHIKSMLSRSSDKARLAYGRVAGEVKRRWIPIGTTNDDLYLGDRTGNRRWRPMKVVEGGKCDPKLIEESRDQIYGAVVARWKAGERPNFDKALYEELAMSTKRRELIDVIGERLTDQLGKEADGDDAVYGKITVEGATRIAVGNPIPMNNNQASDIANAMAGLGFERVRMRIDGQRKVLYRRFRTKDEMMQVIDVSVDDRGNVLDVSTRKAKEPPFSGASM